MRCLSLFLVLFSVACGDGGELVANRMPQAFAGFDQAVAQGSSVQLDGSRSFDPDGNGLEYLWSVVQAPQGVTLTNASSAQAVLSSTANFQGTVTVALQVSDGPVVSWPDWVAISFVPATSLASASAVAGINRHLRRGQPLILDGGESTGLIDRYRWTHLLSPAQDRRDIDDGVTTLLSDLEPGLHVFGLSVGSNDRWSTMDCVSISVSAEERQDLFPEVQIETQSSDSVTLIANAASEVTWALISSPSGQSNQLDGQGDNGTRLEYRSETNGMHLFAATLSNGLSDWVAVELENSP
jgi:hypothetical protein